MFKPFEKNIVLDIENITIHPNFVNGKGGQETRESNPTPFLGRKLIEPFLDKIEECLMSGVKVIYRWHFNDIWLSLNPINKY